jgi:glycine/D-amino acid oxidase-like deaminating enzyme
MKTASVVVCGAGIAGVSAAFHLAVRQGLKGVLLVDELAPLTLTSDKSTEAYRNWWPGPGDSMVRFMDRSIDLLDELALESDNFFKMSRRGYVFLTADPNHVPLMERSATEISRLGAGPLRYHRGRSDDPSYPPCASEGFDPQLTGADLVLDPALIRQRYPFISQQAVAMLHPRRCGWMSAQQLGMYLLEQAKEHGVKFLKGRITGITVSAGQIETVHVNSDKAPIRISTRNFVIAAGPLAKNVGAMIGVDLPVFNELHAKIAFPDSLGVVPRDAPLMVWNDPIILPWTAEDRKLLAAGKKTRWLLEPLPGSVHFRPEGGSGSQTLLALWAYAVKTQEPVWPPAFAPEYAEVVMRGLAVMVPGVSAYIGKTGKPVVDGGYYCRTQENRPLIGPLPVKGAYISGALSGFGIMAAMAAGDLVALHVAGSELPDYAAAFHFGRYEDPDYRNLLAGWDAASGQL